MTKHRTLNGSPIPSRHWCRFSRYEVVDGVIRPHPKATLESYEVATEDAKLVDGERPYQRLMRLTQQIELRRPHEGAPSEVANERARKDLLQWCRTYGLLGVLPHCWITVSYAPRWEPAIDYLRGFVAPPLAAEDVFGSKVIPVQQSIWRVNAGWSRKPDMNIHATADASHQGELYDEGEGETKFAVPRALLREIGASEVSRLALDDIRWRRFFPGVSEAVAKTTDYGWPGIRRAAGVDRFWSAYGEPLEVFIETARMLGRAAAAMATTAAGDDLRVSNALDPVNQLAGVVSPAAAFDAEGNLRTYWSSPSLIGLLAFHLLTDLTGRHTVRRCDVCRGFFVAARTDRRNRHYCSPRCRATAQKRRHRAKSITPSDNKEPTDD